ncbi:MAG TPA: hypothetical protein VGH96_06190 [Streptosporangiaceae bacterium]
MSDSYLGATESGLLGAPLARRLGAYSDQRRLFPHQGTLQLTPRVLVLGGWRVIRREEVASVRLTFTRAYRRSQAAGVRGSYTSFGLYGNLGKPLVLSLHDDEPVYLLIGFRWFTGVNQARRWAPWLQAWSSTEVPAACDEGLSPRSSWRSWSSAAFPAATSTSPSTPARHHTSCRPEDDDVRRRDASHRPGNDRAAVAQSWPLAARRHSFRSGPAGQQPRGTAPWHPDGGRSTGD